MMKTSAEGMSQAGNITDKFADWAGKCKQALLFIVEAEVRARSNIGRLAGLAIVSDVDVDIAGDLVAAFLWKIAEQVVALGVAPPALEAARFHDGLGFVDPHADVNVLQDVALGRLLVHEGLHGAWRSRLRTADAAGQEGQ
jgi:hypothetical protein